jgi:choline dehydrogenase
MGWRTWMTSSDACRRRAAGIRLTAPDEKIGADTIILAAGAYNSIVVLMRSGLGPAEHLRALGIPVLRHMPGVART